MKGWRGFFGVAALAACLVGSARPVGAAYLEDAGWGLLTVLSNVLYMPAKLTYAALGGLTGGLAFGLTGGNLETAETVWTTSMAGTYVVTPGMLRGEEAIAFAGSPSSGETAKSEEPADQDSAHQLHEQQLGGAGS